MVRRLESKPYRVHRVPHSSKSQENHRYEAHVMERGKGEAEFYDIVKKLTLIRHIIKWLVLV